MTTLTYYKIRNKKNPELFRKADGTWNTSGKVYDTLGKLRAIITQHMNSTNDYYRSKVQDWEFVEYEVQVKEVKQLIDIVKPEKVWNLLKRWLNIILNSTLVPCTCPVAAWHIGIKVRESVTAVNIVWP